MIVGPDPEDRSIPSFWRGRPVLVTGAQGFIGSWLVEALLEREAEVVVLLRDEPPRSRFAIEDMAAGCTLVRGDLGEMLQLLRVVNEHSVEAVFHLAAQTIVGTANRSPLSTFEANIRGTYNLLEACRLCESVRRVVVASSDKAYGDHDELPYSESAPLRPSYPYDVSKACADLIARSYAATYELPVAVTRLANVYGGGDFNFSRIVPDTVRSLLEGRRPVVRSDATPERDFMYVEDAVDVYLAIAEGLDRREVTGQAFNAGSGRPVSVGAIVEAVIEISGTDLEPDIRSNTPPAGEIQRQYVDSTLVRRTFGWRPRYELEQGLRMTYDWYERHLGLLPTLLELPARSRPVRSGRAGRPDGSAPPAPACSP
jgi:CDP-glucose 4,6-dehydratase